MMHPHLREIIEVVERVVSIEARPCGEVSPERAMDVDPVTGSWEETMGVVKGVAAARGIPLQHGVTDRHFSVHEPCTHPGHYELE